MENEKWEKFDEERKKSENHVSEISLVGFGVSENQKEMKEKK